MQVDLAMTKYSSSSIVSKYSDSENGFGPKIFLLNTNFITLPEQGMENIKNTWFGPCFVIKIFKLF